MLRYGMERKAFEMKANDNIVLSDKEKEKILKKLTKNFADVLTTLKFDLTDENLVDTPKRIAKAWFLELLAGCYCDEPKVTVFDNTEGIIHMVCL